VNCQKKGFADHTTFSLGFNGRFQDGSALAGTRMCPLWILLKQDDGGGGNWSYKTCKAPAKLSPSTNQRPTTSFFYRPDALPVAQPTASEH